MRTRPKARRARRAALVLALATATVAGLYTTASSGPEPPKDGPALTPETTTIAPPGDQIAPVPSTRTVPASSSAPTDVSCDGTWFDNPVLRYGLCVPPGWGFTDFTSPSPLARIPERVLPAVHLVSARAFPWRAGDLPFDAVRDRGVVDMELSILEPGIGFEGECEPTQPRIASGITLLQCEQHYDWLGLPAPTGLLRATKIVIPLAGADEALGHAGARLLVIARTSATVSVKEGSALWSIVDSIRPY